MKRWLYPLELSIILVILVSVYFRNIPAPSFHSDESQWIATSAYFEPFIQGDFSSSVWEKSYWTLTQPPLTRYIIAMGRLVGGYRADELNVPWMGSLSDEENEARGAIPDSDLLWWSRLPMALLVVVSGGMLFLAAAALGGRVAGYTVLIFFVATPYLLKMLGRAMGESPLLFWTMLAAASAVVALRYWPQRRGLWWLVVGGVCGGLAGSAKLNGLAATGTAVIVGLCVFIKYRKSLTSEGKRFVGTAVFLTPLIALLTFFLLNPFLYPAPVQNMAAMWNNRTEAMQRQIDNSPERAILDWETRLQVVPEYIFVRYSPAQLEKPLLNLLMTAVGLAYLVWLSKGWFATNSGTTWQQATALVTLSMALLMVLPSLATPINYERYFLFPVILNLLCVALSVSLIWKTLIRVVRSR